MWFGGVRWLDLAWYSRRCFAPKLRWEAIGRGDTYQRGKGRAVGASTCVLASVSRRLLLGLEVMASQTLPS